ncbi:MAG: biotin/lipoate A/B protein ligase family protein [Bacillota bacterium]|nr:biotin/lipoate A/B protein ligase family protein [Bacillota bacterium]
MWRFIGLAEADGPWNMAVDEAILRAVGQGKAPPTVRFYTWNPPALSLGYFQDYGREVNEEGCRRLGVQCVRRPTGGRAVLHDREVTYAFVFPEGDPLLPPGVVASCRAIGEGIAAGLQRLGVAVDPLSGKGRQARGRSAACFDAPSWYEVTAGGRKLVGSAQVRRHGAVLQHGSILLEFDVDRLLAVLNLAGQGRPGGGEGGAELRRRLLAGVASLAQLLGSPPPPARVAEAVAAGWQERLGMAFQPGELAAEERALAERLRAKYAGREWTAFRREPPL